MVNFCTVVACCLTAFAIAACMTQQSASAGDSDKEKVKGQFEAVKPSPEHVKLKEMEGTWKATIKPTGRPESKGTMSIKMDLGGLWLVWHFTSEKGDFSGRRMDTYDPQAKKYYAVWIDSTSTTPLHMSGTYEGNKMVMDGEARGPDGKMHKMKFVTEMKDKNNMVFTAYAPGPDGKEGAIMNIIYERAKIAGESGTEKMPVFRFTAVRYQVKDVDRSVAFYTKHLGFKLEQQSGTAFARVSHGAFTLWLSGPKSSGSRPMPDGRQQEPGGWNRLALEVEDLPSRVAALKKEGVRFRNEIEVGPGGKQTQIEDPDGNPIELFELAK